MILIHCRWLKPTVLKQNKRGFSQNSKSLILAKAPNILNLLSVG